MGQVFFALRLMRLRAQVGVRNWRDSAEELRLLPRIQYLLEFLLLTGTSLCHLFLLAWASISSLKAAHFGCSGFKQSAPLRSNSAPPRSGASGQCPPRSQSSRWLDADQLDIELLHRRDQINYVNTLADCDWGNHILRRRCCFGKPNPCYSRFGSEDTILNIGKSNWRNRKDRVDLHA